MSAAGAKPWYREFWLWFVMTPVIAAVIGGFATLIIAGRPPPLVVDDFGQIALTVERNQQRDKRAAELGLAAELRFDAGPGKDRRTAVVRLSGDAPERLRLDLIHPTRDDRDESVMLGRSGELYAGVISRPAGRLYLQIADENGTWRLTGNLAPEQQLVRLTAGSAP